ncbi:MAG: hypothetical protein QOI36_5130, partial [Pseudonocardiales bacterium]|nr:hypothetical protein [Pseudonocardiales bacterium]
PPLHSMFHELRHSDRHPIPRTHERRARCSPQRRRRRPCRIGRRPIHSLTRLGASSPTRHTTAAGTSSVRVARCSGRYFVRASREEAERRPEPQRRVSSQLAVRGKSGLAADRAAADLQSTLLGGRPPWTPYRDERPRHRPKDTDAGTALRSRSNRPAGDRCYGAGQRRRRTRQPSPVPGRVPSRRP